MANFSLNPQVAIRSSAAGSGVDITVGEGMERHTLSCGDPILASWLLRLKEPTSEAELYESAAQALALDPAGARRLVNYLASHRVLQPSSREAADLETQRLRERWERWGWRDALDFHLAVRNYEFSLGTPSGWDEQDRCMAEYQRAAESGDDEVSPGPYKDYPCAPRIELPRSDAQLSQASFSNVLYRRRTVRNFGQLPVPLPEFAELLQHSFAATHETDHPILGMQILRTSPSGGARHPIEVYPVVLNVQGLDPGVYHYSVRDHALELIRAGHFAREMYELGHQQAQLDRAGAVLFFSVRWARHQWKYRYARSYRMVMFDVAHLVQTNLLVATALGLRSFLTPALKDREVTSLLQLPNDLEESPLYLTAFGTKP